jgi:pimeloyl-ACP methyl ester carboxylesterase
MHSPISTDRSASGAQFIALLHGSAGSPRQWQLHMQHLAPRHRVAAPALLGYSGTPESPADASITLRAEAAHVAQSLATASDGLHLVGHGYGAAVALHFALLQPERVRSLVLYEPTLFHVLRERGPSQPHATSVGMALSAAVQRRYEAGDLLGAGWVFHDYWCGDGAWERLAGERRQAIAQRMPKVAAELHALLGESTPLARYAALRMPVLLVHGQRTRTTARLIAKHLAGTMRQAELIELPGAGHSGAIDHPEALCRLVDAFLTAQGDGEQPFAWASLLRGRSERAPEARDEDALPFALPAVI